MSKRHKHLFLVMAVLFGVLFVGCSSQDKAWQKGAKNCKTVYRECFNECRKGDISDKECRKNCEGKQSMCNILNKKICFAKCAERYDKKSGAYRNCQSNCAKKN